MTVELQVELPAPLDIAGSLELFRRSGDDLIDRWDGTRLARAAPLPRGGWAPFLAAPTGGIERPGFAVTVQSASVVEAVRGTVATTFVDLEQNDFARLVAEDPVMAALSARFPGIRQIRQLDLFTALVRCISAQQVNLRWAAVTRRRLAEAFGRRHEIGGETVYALDPERVARANPADIRALQYTTSKAVALVGAARAIVDEHLTSDDLQRLEDDEVIVRLVALRGIGRWSAEWVLARTLGRPRVVAGDLGVRKAVGLAYLGRPAPGEADVHAATAHWGASAGAAQALLLHALAEGALTPARSGSPAGSRR